MHVHRITMTMSSSTTHPSRVANIHSTENPKSTKSTRRRPPAPQPPSSSLSRSQLRRKIRDVSRLLRAIPVAPVSSLGGSGAKGNTGLGHVNKLSATARAEHERALDAYKHELSSQQRESKRQVLHKRYHKVRFFERQKATRLLSRCQRELAQWQGPNHSAEKVALEGKVYKAELDLNYVLHFPEMEKYISIYKQGNDPKTNARKSIVRAEIEKRMKEGTLDQPNMGSNESPHESEHQQPMGKSGVRNTEVTCSTERADEKPLNSSYGDDEQGFFEEL